GRVRRNSAGERREPYRALLARGRPLRGSPPRASPPPPPPQAPPPSADARHAHPQEGSLMQLVVPLGSTVTAVLDGHSAVDGANFPDGSKLTATSNDPAVATVPADGGGIPPGGASSEVTFPVTVVGPGSTDLQAT